MKIVRLEANNVLRLSAVSITPDGNMVVIGGDNEQGKTSVLNAIEMALGGKDSIPPKPIKDGAKKASIVVDLGDLIVERTFTESGTALSVKSKDGAKYTTPQTILDGLVGKMAFDPLAFKNMEPKQQAETLRKLVGLDFSDIDAKRKATFERRTDVNRRVKDMTARLAGAPPMHADTPKEEVSISKLVSEVETRRTLNSDHGKKRSVLADKKEANEIMLRDIKRIEDELSVKKKMAERFDEEIKEMQPLVDALVDADVQEVQKQIDNAETTNRHVRENAARSKMASELAEQEKAADALTSELTDVDKQKADLLTKAKFPVEGLSLSDDGVLYKGVPLEQCSGAQSVEVTVSMGFAMNPKLRVVLVKDPAYIGDRFLQIIAAIAEKHDGQVWLERGGEGKECSVVIEDGHVKA